MIISNSPRNVLKKKNPQTRTHQQLLSEDSLADLQEFIKFTSADSKRVSSAKGHDLNVGEVSF